MIDRLIPTYGNWGGPGWSGGRWCPPATTDWDCQPVDSMDELFRIHDKAYRSAFREIIDYGDRLLIKELLKLGQPSGWPKPPKDIIYATVYRYAAIVVFSIRCLLRGNI